MYIVQHKKTAEKLTATVLVNQIRKPPDVAQPDGVAYAREQEVEFVGPSSSLFPRQDLAPGGRFTSSCCCCAGYHSTNTLTSTKKLTIKYTSAANGIDNESCSQWVYRNLLTREKSPVFD
jgi:hypothetical protein